MSRVQTVHELDATFGESPIQYKNIYQDHAKNDQHPSFLETAPLIPQMKDRSSEGEIVTQIGKRYQKSQSVQTVSTTNAHHPVGPYRPRRRGTPVISRPRHDTPHPPPFYFSSLSQSLAPSTAANKFVQRDGAGRPSPSPTLPRSFRHPRRR